ncbi:hypothetical protein [Roseibium sp. LAB1]
MASQYQIIIQNLSNTTVSFYAFQQQAGFTNSGANLTVQSSSLATGALAPHATSGSQLTFGFDTQVYAGAVSTNTQSGMANFNVLISFSNVQNVVSQTSAVQPIDLTPATGQSNNHTNLSLNPLGLSSAAYQSGPLPGNFGIQVPAFTPAPTPDLFCGCAAINQNGGITLSSFVAPQPNSQLGCAPLPIYFVKVGSHAVGEIITYDTSQSARCDFSQGYSVFNVAYNADGTFTTKGS